jgi:hypothetical protein
MKYQLGYKFKKATGVRRDICIIVDYLTTTNIKGEIVKHEYIISFEFLDELFFDSCPIATIDRGSKV